MIKVTIIAISKLKEKYLKDASDEYLKRLSRYCKLQVVEIEPERLNDNPSQNEINSALEKEAQAVFKRIPESAYVAAMCIEGKKAVERELCKNAVVGTVFFGRYNVHNRQFLRTCRFGEEKGGYMPVRVGYDISAPAF